MKRLLFSLFIFLFYSSNSNAYTVNAPLDEAKRQKICYLVDEARGEMSLASEDLISDEKTLAAYNNLRAALDKQSALSLPEIDYKWLLAVEDEYACRGITLPLLTLALAIGLAHIGKYMSSHHTPIAGIPFGALAPAIASSSASQVGH